MLWGFLEVPMNPTTNIIYQLKHQDNQNNSRKAANYFQKNMLGNLRIPKIQHVESFGKGGSLNI